MDGTEVGRMKDAIDLEWGAEQAQAVAKAQPMQIGDAKLSMKRDDGTWVDLGSVTDVVIRPIPGITPEREYLSRMDFPLPHSAKGFRL
jgi:hypothetical protein